MFNSNIEFPKKSNINGFFKQLDNLKPLECIAFEFNPFVNPNEITITGKYQENKDITKDMY